MFFKSLEKYNGIEEEKTDIVNKPNPKQKRKVKRKVKRKLEEQKTKKQKRKNIVYL